MAKSMLGTWRRDDIQNEERRDRTGEKEVVTEYHHTKLWQTDHVAKFTDN